MKVITIAALSENDLGETSGRYLGSFTQVKLAFEFIGRDLTVSPEFCHVKQQRGGWKPATLSRINKALRTTGSVVIYNDIGEPAYAMHLSQMNPTETGE